MKVSVILPARNELYLAQTVNDLMKNLTGDTEVIVVLDGYWPDKLPDDDKRLTILHREKKGMRASINAGVAVARGEYVLKLDAHCRVAYGFDEVLSSQCDKDWIIIPRRYSLELDTWSPKRYRPFVDYEYLHWPFGPEMRKRPGLRAWVWDDRIIKRVDKELDENMTFQGSSWLMHRDYFINGIGYLSDDGYGTFICEAQEIGLKCWLGGGKIMTNKKTWYAHLWKGQPYRDAYKALYGASYTRIGPTEFKDGNQFTIDYWLNNKWDGRKHDFEWLIDKFAPVPSWKEEERPWTH